MRIILSHAGGTVPYLAERIAGIISMVDREGRPLIIQRIEEVQQILGEMQRVTASLQRLYIFHAIQELVKPSQILFGSDYPWVDEMIAAFTVRGIENYDGFDNQMHRAIERENTLALFPRLKERE